MPLQIQRSGLVTCVDVGARRLKWRFFVPAWATDAEREARVFVAYLEGDPLARRYAPFVAYTERGVWYWPDTRPEADPSLLTADGQLTEIGTWYLP